MFTFRKLKLVSNYDLSKYVDLEPFLIYQKITARWEKLTLSNRLVVRQGN